MNNAEDRLYPQHKTKVGVIVNKKGEKISATLIDVIQDCIVLNTEKGIFPGTAVDITMNRINNHAIHGNVEWVLLTNRKGKFQYQLGIAADQNQAAEHIRKNVLLETAK